MTRFGHGVTWCLFLLAFLSVLIGGQSLTLTASDPSAATAVAATATTAPANMSPTTTRSTSSRPRSIRAPRNVQIPHSRVHAGVAAEAEAAVVATERTAAQALKPSEAVQRWDEFLGEGPTTNLHPRTGLPDPNRIVSSDGLRSIRFGPHEMNSPPTKFHFHEETWSFESGSNTWFVDNVLVRVPLPKGAW